MSVWRSIVAWLAALSADPVVIDEADVRAHASVAAAYATFAPDAPAPVPPSPPAPPANACPCKGKCVGGKYQPDGIIWMACSAGCKTCKAAAAPASVCPDGKCSQSCPCNGTKRVGGQACPCGPNCACAKGR